MSIDEAGGVYIPKKIGWTVVVGAVIFLVTQVALYVEARANVSNEIGNLKVAQLDTKSRGDDIRRRLELLERNGDRITRLEEQSKVMVDMLREVRDDLRSRPR